MIEENTSSLGNETRLIFLDVDGVLNCVSTLDRCGVYIGIDDEKVKLLKTIVDSTNAKLILTSTWKEYWFVNPMLKRHQDELANHLDKKLMKYGLRIIDKIDDSEISRGEAILEFLKYVEHHDIRVSGYVIIDDKTFDYKKVGLLDHLVRTTYRYGLTTKYVTKVVKVLNGRVNDNGKRNN